MQRAKTWLFVGVLAALVACDGSSSVVAPGRDAARDQSVNTPDSAADAALDTSVDVTDIGLDAPVDTGIDTGLDAPDDAAPDAELDATDAPADVSADVTADVSADGSDGCSVSPDSCPADQHCDATSRRCVPGCRSDEGCAATAATPRCLVSSHACVACLTNEHCPLGRLCMGNVCVPGCSTELGCPVGQTCCSGGCVDTRTNTANCGACGTTCTVPSAMASCAAGACAVGACADGFGNCDGVVSNGCETSTRDNPSHCGACGRTCAARPASSSVCAMGACVYTCNPGFADCNGLPDDGCEVNLQTDVNHCNGCGMLCPARPGSAARCAMGACAYDCTAGFADCNGVAADGCETNLNTSATDCGACGMACVFINASGRCLAGRCAIGACNPGFGNCDGIEGNGCEVDVRASPMHCGGCGMACPLRPGTDVRCADGVCAYACQTGRLDCDGVESNGCETNPTVNATHCGRCGNVCPTGAECVAGTCVCPLGTVTCGTSCVSLVADPDNCGRCGNVCPGAQVCVAGACVPTCSVGSTLCGDRCVLLGTDVLNCGRCGNACPAENSCSGGVCTPIIGTPVIGCADGQREGFVSLTTFPNIAACAGGWTLPGIFPAPSRSGVAACAASGDDSAIPNGTGCSSADLCATGWHLCRGGEVTPRVATGCAATTFPTGTFFAASVSGTGCGVCALLSGTVTSGCNSSNCVTNCREDPTLNNDFFGCGNTGGAVTPSACDGLNVFSNNNCGSLAAPWACGGAIMESITVTKPSSAGGGVLCCR